MLLYGTTVNKKMQNKKLVRNLNKIFKISF